MSSHLQAQRYAEETKREFAEMIQVAEPLLIEAKTALLAAWADSVSDTGYPSNSSARVIAIATLRPIIESLLESDSDEVLPGLQLWLAALLRDL